MPALCRHISTNMLYMSATYRYALLYRTFKTKNNNMYHINKYLKQYGNLNTNDVFKYVSELRISDASKNTLLSHFRAFAKKQGIALEIQNKRIKKAQKVPPRAIELESIRPSLFDNQIDYLLFMFMYETGVRVSELCQIKVVQLSDNVIKVIGKGNKERIIVPTQKTVQGLRKVCSGTYITPYSYSMTRHIITKYLKRFKEEGKISGNALSPHGLRHAFATHLNENGASLLSIQMALGHSSIATTEKYTYINLDHLKDVHSRCFK